jgi:16S rRNA C1402 (ribose-2'-O) methylase RsmI
LQRNKFQKTKKKKRQTKVAKEKSRTFIIFDTLKRKNTTMERLDRLAGYFNEREKKRLEAKTKESLNGVPEMSVS